MHDTITELEVNEPAVRGWLKKMNGVAPVKGHRYTREGDGAWCTCGHYCGGLDWTAPNLRDDRSERFQLHLRLVTNLNTTNH